MPKRKLGRPITFPELCSLIHVIVSSCPVGQSTADVTAAVRLAGWQTSTTSVRKCLEYLANNGLVEAEVDYADHWVWYSANWLYGGGNL